MKNYDRERLKKDETPLLAPCGIFCGACDAFLGTSKSLAKELYRILKGFNIVDVSSIVLGVEQERMEDFLCILEKIMEARKCPGCHSGGGNPACLIKLCVLEKEYLSCAECDKMPCNLITREGITDTEDVCFYLEMITKRYAGWNVKNLERIQQVGYRQFVDEMQKKVKNGFLTSDVISGDMVITEAIQKMTGDK